MSYRYDWQGVVYSSMSILDIPRSLQYTYPFMFPMNTGNMNMGNRATSTAIEGLLWSYSKTSEAFLAFSNASSHDIHVKLGKFREDRRGQPEEDVFTVPAKNTVLRPAAAAEDDAEHSLAGLRITFDADSDSLSILGGIEDDAHGYSANLPLAPIPEHPTLKANNSSASVGIMVGKQDPMMGFPESLRFQPYAYFRNIGPEPIRLSSTVIYNVGGKSESKALPDLFIPPFHSRELAVSDLARDLKPEGSITLAYSYTGQAGALLTATGSVDRTGNYVFAVEPRAIGRSASKSAIYWQMANGFDTMYTLWNPDAQAEDLLLIFYYGANQSYEHPVHLDPNESVMVDIMQLAQMGIPDQKGHLLPLSAAEGSLVIAAGNGSEYDPISVVLSGGTYNPKTATCGVVCTTCNGCTSFPSLTPDPFGAGIGGSGWMYDQCPWYTGTLYTYSSSASWTSSDTGIAMVQSDNTSNPGLTSGIGAGTASISASAQNIPPNPGQICEPTNPVCPIANPTQSGPAAVCSVSITSAAITSNHIGTTLAPSGQSGAFSLWESTGSANSYSVNAVARPAGSYTDGFNLTPSSTTGQYSTIYAAWSACSAQVVSSASYAFYDYGNTRHSQYTLINGSSCSGSQQKAYVITNLSACYSSGLQTTTLPSSFMAQTSLNGSGYYSGFGYVKGVSATSCANATKGKPSDAKGGNNGNVFVEVPSITGTCNQGLSSTTVAQLSAQCGLNIFLTGYGSPGTEKTVEDNCPACSNSPGSAHFDDWTTSGGSACGLTVPDLGTFVTEQVQQ